MEYAYERLLESACADFVGRGTLRTFIDRLRDLYAKIGANINAAERVAIEAKFTEATAALAVGRWAAAMKNALTLVKLIDDATDAV